MDGRNYVALRRLSTIDDMTLAAVGETCERVPVESLPGLLANGTIQARGVEDDAVPAPRPTRSGRK